MTIAYLNGEFLPLEKTQVSAMDRGFLFGDGVYEVIPVYAGRLFRLTHHLQRLTSSLAAIHLTIPVTQQQWTDLCVELVKRNGGGDQSLYLQCTRGPAPVRDHIIPPQVKPTIFAYSMPLIAKPMAELSQGITAITLVDNRWSQCNIKAITLLANILLRQKAIAAGAYEAILLRDGLALEGTSTNLFVINDNTIITPPTNSFILGGITRDVVLELAKKYHYASQETDISVAALSSADEIWLTSSTREIMPVIRLNDQPVGNGKAGPMWYKLIQHYQDFKQQL